MLKVNLVPSRPLLIHGKPCKFLLSKLNLALLLSQLRFTLFQLFLLLFALIVEELLVLYLLDSLLSRLYLQELAIELLCDWRTLPVRHSDPMSIQSFSQQDRDRELFLNL